MHCSQCRCSSFCVPDSRSIQTADQSVPVSATLTRCCSCQQEVSSNASAPWIRRCLSPDYTLQQASTTNSDTVQEPSYCSDGRAESHKSKFHCWVGVLCFSVIAENIAKIHHTSYTAEKQILWSTFPSQTIWVFNHGEVTGSKAAKFGEIMRNKGHYAVQGHSRLSIIAPMESPYMSSYMWLSSYLEPFPRYGRLFVKFLLSTERVSLFNSLVWDKPLNSGLRNLASRN